MEKHSKWGVILRVVAFRSHVEFLGRTRVIWPVWLVTAGMMSQKRITVDTARWIIVIHIVKLGFSRGRLWWRGDGTAGDTIGGFRLVVSCWIAPLLLLLTSGRPQCTE
jgi:hypothetical protein